MQTNRPRREPSKERNSNDAIQIVSPDDEKPKSRQKPSNQETTDLSLVSEDESIKPHDNHVSECFIIYYSIHLDSFFIQQNSIATVESSSVTPR